MFEKIGLLLKFVNKISREITKSFTVASPKAASSSSSSLTASHTASWRLIASNSSSEYFGTKTLPLFFPKNVMK